VTGSFTAAGGFADVQLCGVYRNKMQTEGILTNAEDLYDHLPPYERRYLAEDAADELAAELVELGYDVRADPNQLERISNIPRPAPSVISLEAAATRGRITRAAGQPFIDRYAA